MSQKYLNVLYLFISGEDMVSGESLEYIFQFKSCIKC